jgi:hypothetical protein
MWPLGLLLDKKNQKNIHSIACKNYQDHKNSNLFECSQTYSGYYKIICVPNFSNAEKKFRSGEKNLATKIFQNLASLVCDRKFWIPSISEKQLLCTVYILGTYYSV